MIPLWKPQQRAFTFGKKRSRVAYFCEPRTGKTYLTLAHLEEEVSDNFAGVLVTLLANKESTWISKLNEYFPNLNCSDDWEVFKKMKPPRLFVVHFEGLGKIIKRLCKYKHINWMCVDEAHRLGNRGTAISRACARMSWVDRKIILTGTPIESKPDDLFGQFRFLAPEVFGTNWQKFFEYWMDWPRIDLSDVVVGGNQWQELILRQRILQKQAKFREDLRPELNEKLAPFAYHLGKEDVGIAKARVNKVLVKMTPYQRLMDNQIRREGVTWTNKGVRIISPLPVTKVMKRRQIASGFIYDEDKNLHPVARNKLRVLVKLFKETPKPVIIFTAFRPDNAAIVRALRKEGYDVEPFHGGIPKKKRPQLLERFQSADLDGMVCQSRTGGAGVDMWKSRHMIVHSLGHSSIDYEQLTSRADMAHRDAAEITVLCSENSIDEDVYELLLDKGLHGRKLMSALKELHHG